MSDPYAHFKKPPVDEDKMAQLSRLATLAVHLELEVVDKETQLKAAQKALRDVIEGEIPEIMEELQMESFSKENLKVTVTPKIRASIPKARQAEAYKWLEEHEAGGMIKREIVVPFPNSKGDEAKDLLARLAGLNFAVAQKRTVHTQTLVAYVRKQLEAGKEIPTDLFGVFEQKVAKVKVT